MDNLKITKDADKAAFYVQLNKLVMKDGQQYTVCYTM
jgi:hypothetical protein